MQCGGSMGINVNLKDYDSAIECLKKTTTYSEIYNNINSVLNNLDYNVLSSVKEQLISSRDIINNTKFNVDDIKQKISKNKSTYEEIESRFGKSVVAAAAISGVVAASNREKQNLNYNSNNIPTITKVEEETGALLSGSWDIVDDLTTGMKDIINGIGDAFSSAGAAICDFFTSSPDAKLAAFFKSADALIEEATNEIGQFVKSTAASFANVAIGFSEGVAWVGEMVADTGAIVGTAVECAFLGAADAVAWGWNKLNGKDHKFIIGQIWNEKMTKTMEKVKESKVANAYSDFYKNNEIGKWLDENAISLCKSTGGAYSLAKNLGTVAGNLGLSFLTFGVAGGLLGSSGKVVAAKAGQMAATAAFTGFGKGAESAWQKGATLTEGLIYGGLSSAWEGLQFFLGAKIGAQGGYGDKIAEKILSEGATVTQKMLVASGSRILLDTLDGAAEGFVQPILQTIYADGYYNADGEFILFTKEDGPFKRMAALFDDNGGWGTVGMQALTAFSASTFGELWSWRKYRKQQKKNNAAEAAASQTNLVEDIEEKIHREHPKLYEQLEKIKQKLGQSDVSIDDLTKEKDELFKLGYTNEELIDILPLSTQRNLGIIILTTEEQKLIKEVIEGDIMLSFGYTEIMNPSGYVTTKDFLTIMDRLDDEDFIKLDRLFSDVENNIKGFAGYGAQQKAIDYAMEQNGELKMKLIEKVQKTFPNITVEEAERLLTGIDSKGGLCSYAQSANAIYTIFADKPNEFKKIFGYDMYIIDSNGVKTLNDAELMTDMFLFKNKDNTNIISWNGTGYDIAESHAKQIRMSNPKNNGFDVDGLEEFLKTKNVNVKFTDHLIASEKLNYKIKSEKEVANDIRKAIISGEPIGFNGGHVDGVQSFNIYEPNGELFMKSSYFGDGTISNGIAGGHAMYITGVDTMGNVSISTWSQKKVVKLDELLKAGIFKINKLSIKEVANDVVDNAINDAVTLDWADILSKSTDELLGDAASSAASNAVSDVLDWDDILSKSTDELLGDAASSAVSSVASDVASNALSSTVGDVLDYDDIMSMNINEIFGKEITITDEKFGFDDIVSFDMSKI